MRHLYQPTGLKSKSHHGKQPMNLKIDQESPSAGARALWYISVEVPERRGLMRCLVLLGGLSDAPPLPERPTVIPKHWSNRRFAAFSGRTRRLEIAAGRAASAASSAEGPGHLAIVPFNSSKFQIEP